MRKITEDGVRFASPINGDRLLLAPEVSMQIQTVLNSDIVMQFDECTPYDVQRGEETHITTDAEARHSMERPLRWAARCTAEFGRLRNSNALPLQACRDACFTRDRALGIRRQKPGSSIAARVNLLGNKGSLLCSEALLPPTGSLYEHKGHQGALIRGSGSWFFHRMSLPPDGEDRQNEVKNRSNH